MNRVIARREASGRPACLLVEGDITAEKVDAIVNAANNRLQHGGGLAAAIVRRGGGTIQAESDEWVRRNGEVTHARPAVTGAGRLPCRAVIHAVGPVWGSGGEDGKLRAAVSGALAAADERGFASIAVPAVSTGIFGFPKERAAGVILQAIEDYSAAHPASSLREIRLVLFDAPTLHAFQEEFNRRWPTSPASPTTKSA